MQLFSVVTDLDDDLLEKLGGKVGIGGSYSANGVQAPNGTWFVHNPDPKPLYPGVKLKSESGCLISDISAGPALSYRGLPCNTTCNALCEFY